MIFWYIQDAETSVIWGLNMILRYQTSTVSQNLVCAILPAKLFLTLLKNKNRRKHIDSEKINHFTNN